MGREESDRRQTLRGLPESEIVRGLRGLADDFHTAGNGMAADFLDEVTDRLVRSAELCTFTPRGWNRDAPETCGKFARYLVVNRTTGESGFACPEHHGKDDDADNYFDMYQGPVT